MDAPPTPAPLALPTRPWVAVIANPFSGARSNRKLVARLAAALTHAHLDVRTIWDRDERRAVLAHRDLRRRCAAVVVAGGDGTVADVLNEPPANALSPDGTPPLPVGGVPLAVLPLGNENLLAKQFGFTGRPDALVQAILAGKSRTVDLGRIVGMEDGGCRMADGKIPPPPLAPLSSPLAPLPSSLTPPLHRRFGLLLSAGLDAQIVHHLSRWRCASPRLRRVRRLSYLRPTIGSLLHYKYPEIELRTESQTVRGSHAFVFNLPGYALGLRFVPGCLEDDGLLDWIVFQRPGPLPALHALWAIYHQRHLNLADVKHGKARRVELRSATPVPLQIDGDPAGTTPVAMEVEPGVLRVVAG